MDVKIEINVYPNANRIIGETKKAMIISGGGTKGIHSIGLFRYLFESNPYVDLNSIGLFAGTSVGSFFAVAFALGLKKDDLMKLIEVIDLDQLFCNPLVAAFRFLFYGHLYGNDGRNNIIRNIIEMRLNSIREQLNDPLINANQITFSQLRQLIDSHPDTYKHLLINAVDLSRNTEVFFTTLNDNYDNITIYDAMLSSSAYPFAFQPTILYYNQDFDVYHTIDLPGSIKCHLVDGGVASNDVLNYILMNEETFQDYDLWLLKFTDTIDYVEINSWRSLLRRMMYYLFGGKGDLKNKLVQDKYKINTFNLHCTNKTFDTYTKKEMNTIVENVYQKCLTNMDNYCE